MTGSEMIHAERVRQLLEEDFDAANDDAYDRGELILAATGYAVESVPISAPVEVVGGVLVERVEGDSGVLPDWWPWDESWWKPEDPIRNLVKAGALIAAEIDRLQRDAR